MSTKMFQIPKVSYSQLNPNISIYSRILYFFCELWYWESTSPPWQKIYNTISTTQYLQEWTFWLDNGTLSDFFNRIEHFLFYKGTKSFSAAILIIPPIFFYSYYFVPKAIVLYGWLLQLREKKWNSYMFCSIAF